MTEANDLLSGFVGSLIGAFIGGGASLLGAKLQNDKQTKARMADEEAQILGFLGAIEAEITVLWERYEHRVKPGLAQVGEGQWFNFEWPVYQDYFTVYTTNSSLLGRVPDAELRTLIVKTYTCAKGMVDSIKYNSQLNHQYVELSDPLREPHPFRTNQINWLAQLLVAYAVALKGAEAELEELVRDLLPRLKRATSSSRR